MSITVEASESTAVTSVRRYYDLVDAGDVAGLVDLFTADGSYHRPGYEPLVGRSALTGFYSGQRVIKEGKHTLRTIVAQDHEVAVHGEFEGVLRDGKEVSLRFSDFFVLDSAGKFTRRDTFFFAPLV
jgi:steroid Delta-isomerase